MPEADIAPIFIIIPNDSPIKYHSDEFVFFLQREPWVKHAIKKLSLILSKLVLKPTDYKFISIFIEKIVMIANEEIRKINVIKTFRQATRFRVTRSL